MWSGWKLSWMSYIYFGLRGVSLAEDGSGDESGWQINLLQTKDVASQQPLQTK